MPQAIKSIDFFIVTRLNFDNFLIIIANLDIRAVFATINMLNIVKMWLFKITFRAFVAGDYVCFMKNVASAI